jgi:hypothetical protein
MVWCLSTGTTSTGNNVAISFSEYGQIGNIKDDPVITNERITVYTLNSEVLL